jgi:hypothetical protein
MNDQPKPTTGEQEPNCIVRNKGQGTHLEYRHPVDLGETSKPATGEWTDRDVYDLALPYDEVLLAAERAGQKHYRDLFDEVRQALGDLIPTDASKKEIIDKVKQLAAKREKVKE